MPMLLVPLALLGLAVWATWLMSRQPELTTSIVPSVPAGPVGSRGQAPRNGAEVLAYSRLARGEITVEECARIIRVLRQ